MLLTQYKWLPVKLQLAIPNSWEMPCVFFKELGNEIMMQNFNDYWKLLSVITCIHKQLNCMSFC